MESIEWLALALVVVFLINLVPAFMPSSWMVLAFFKIKFGLPLVPLAVSGAVVSGLGRAVLTLASSYLARTVFKSKAKDLERLGSVLQRHENALPVVVFVYALTPLPTNNLFIAAGMVRARLWRVLAGFWAARIPADLFWVWTTNATFSSFKGVLEKGLSPAGIALQSLGIASVVLLYVLPWGKCWRD